MNWTQRNGLIVKMWTDPAFRKGIHTIQVFIKYMGISTESVIFTWKKVLKYCLSTAFQTFFTYSKCKLKHCFEVDHLLWACGQCI